MADLHGLALLIRQSMCMFTISKLTVQWIFKNYQNAPLLVTSIEGRPKMIMSRLSLSLKLITRLAIVCICSWCILTHNL
jgi:hypothetical protein